VVNQVKINQWLKERQIDCDESFADALHCLAMAHKRKCNKNLNDIWQELGIHKRNISYWRYHPNSTMTRSIRRQLIIERAVALFSLTEIEAEVLANKAGLTRIGQAPFSTVFSEKLRTWGGKHGNLYDHVGIDKRTFYKVKSGKHLRKEVLLALLIAMGLSIADIKQCLAAAGYVLSTSLPTDLLIFHLLEHELKDKSGFERLYVINDHLYEMEQPLLESIKRE